MSNEKATSNTNKEQTNSKIYCYYITLVVFPFLCDMQAGCGIYCAEYCAENYYPDNLSSIFPFVYSNLKKN
jgi:hypothetical protein